MNALVALPPRPSERVRLAVYPDNGEAVRAVAADMADLIRRRRQEGRPAVLGLATGSTPIPLYAELVRLHREEGLSFANVVTFNLDEYLGLAAADPQSYHRFMRRHLVDHVDLPPGHVHLLDGTAVGADIERVCREYEAAIRRADGIDLQILGIGRSGHIGFNEPCSSPAARTRLVRLHPLTRRLAAADFGGLAQTPACALTMGTATILEARRILVLAWGRSKAEVVRAAVEGPETRQVPASFVRRHPDALFVLDRDAASALRRYQGEAVAAAAAPRRRTRIRAAAGRVWTCGTGDN
ncbi:MAG TPA: glucosamine-6-phosphate deaminase [Lacunisphaera sp.]|jgi:glucosamine-6-phosphate deaminase|nr:glucosamine-6-phosphate deaminase [Lacunisphaera sp.]